MFDHHLDQAAEVDLGLPAEHFAGLGRVAQQDVDLRGPRVPRVELDEVAIVEVDAARRPARGARGPSGSRRWRRRSRRACPAGASATWPDVVAGESPVALGVEVAHDELLLQPFLDPGGAEGHLAGDERLAAARALVVEQDARAGEEAVGLAVVDRLPVGVELGAGVGAAGVERRVEPLAAAAPSRTSPSSTPGRTSPAG